jgi:hypothetical protein
MLKIKNKTLSLIKNYLENEIKYFGYSTSEDYKTFEDRKLVFRFYKDNRKEIQELRQLKLKV